MIDLYAKLKYFYLIDVNSIVDKIKETETYKDFKRKANASADDLFLAIFAEIIHVAQPYCGFLLSENHITPPSIFNELPEIKIDKIPNRFLCEFSLFHHCIISSFITQVEKHPITSKRYGDSIRLSGSNEDELTQGYFAFADSTVDPNSNQANDVLAYEDPEQDSKSQRFYSRYVQYCKNNKPLDNGQRYYSKQILNMHSSTVINGANDRLTVKRWIGNPCLFLFIDRTVKDFDKELVSTKSSADDMLNKYQKLAQKYIQWHNGLLFETDKILFNHFIEKYYHFSSYYYMNKLLQDIDDPSSTISKLNSPTFLDLTAKYIYRLPITYNRSIFLKYAIDALTDSTNLHSTFPSDPNTRLKYDGHMANDKYTLAALDLYGDYLRALHHIAIPLVTDLWIAITNALHLESKHYEGYILSHFNTITFDYTHDIPYAEHIVTCRAKTFISEYHALECAIQKLMNDGEIQNPVDSSTNNAEDLQNSTSKVAPKSSSPESTLVHKKLLQQVFKVDDTPESNFINSFVNPYLTDASESPYSNDYKEFVFQHSCAIFKLVKKLP